MQVLWNKQIDSNGDVRVGVPLITPTGKKFVKFVNPLFPKSFDSSKMNYFSYIFFFRIKLDNYIFKKTSLWCLLNKSWLGYHSRMVPNYGR